MSIHYAIYFKGQFISHFYTKSHEAAQATFMLFVENEAANGMPMEYYTLRRAAILD